MATSKTTAVRRVNSITADEHDQAAAILCEAFWNSEGPILRLRAKNNRDNLLQIMRNRVAAAVESNSLFLAYQPCGSDSGPSGAQHRGDLSSSSAEIGGEGAQQGQVAAGGKGREKDGEVVVGCAVTTPPGVGFQQLQKHFGQMADQKPAQQVEGAASAAETEDAIMQRWIDNDLVPWFNAFADRTLGPNAFEDSLYISLLAVDHRLRGKGVGREIVQEVIRTADREGWFLTLVSQEEELLPFYESLGFVNKGYDAQTVIGQTVPYWAMQRGERTIPPSNA